MGVMRRWCADTLSPLVFLLHVGCSSKQTAHKLQHDPSEQTRYDQVVQAEPTSPTNLTTISVLATEGGLWLGTSDDESLKIENCASGFDFAALGNALCDLRSKPSLAGQSALELAGIGSVSYQSIISTMDASITAGFDDVDVVGPNSLTIGLPPNHFKKRDPVCVEATPKCSAQGPASRRAGDPMAAPPPPADKAHLRRAPIVVVTTTEILLNDKHLARTRDASRGLEWKIEPLYEALRSRDSSHDDPPGIVILQADSATEFRVINDILKTCNAAGYENIMFAVNRK